ncbi:hypothetical protein SAMN06297422_101158 [Lachnospiraceae bacterium]|nr:hypothetical protein SAMN06297422_101158 [Lachnospiraceae bacterium]
MGKIDYKSIYDKNKEGWKDLTDNPQKYEELLAGHYSDSNHFVYELLQNAEDENASKVLIEYRKNGLVFYHNGDPFDYDDVKGVSSMLMGTKDKTSGQQIGRFGMGFKSVFKYTDEPSIYSDEESFKIVSYLLPVEKEDEWNYISKKEKLKLRLQDGRWYHPFVEEEHLTMIVIPFRKKKQNGITESIDGKDVLEKLKGLTGEIILFLTHIREIVWIDKNTSEYARITISQADTDAHLMTCRIEGSALHGREKINRFLKYKRIFDHSEMTSAEVSVAYNLNGPCTRVNAIEESVPIWVYFPTRERTSLPFLVHGSFETAVSREKLMTPSKFNDYLKKELSDLIAISLEDLAERKMITQDFIRTVLMKAFEDEENNHSIAGLKQRITTAFRTKALLPDLDMNYHMLPELEIAIPFEIADFRNVAMFSETFTHGRRFVAFNNEQQKYFGAYYKWLRDDLRIKAFKLSDWAKNMKSLASVYIEASSKMTNVDKFYSMLSNYRESLFDSGKSFSKYGPYGMAIKDDLPSAWKEFRRMPVVINENRHFIPVYIEDEQNVYLTSSSNYKKINAESLVHHVFSEQYKALFSEAFAIPEFDNYQYVKEKIIRKYIDIDESINFDNDDFEKEHIEDIQQLIALLDEVSDEEVADMVSDASIIKVIDEDDLDSNTFSYPYVVYMPKTEEGFDLKSYFKDITCVIKGKSRGLYEIDYGFYENHGIQVSKLKKLGVINTPIIDGVRKELEGSGKKYWWALGEFCPNINILGLYENIEYIENDEEGDLSKTKSALLLKLLLNNSAKLKGKIKRCKTNSYEEDGVASIITSDPNAYMYGTYRNNVYSKRWIFDKGGELKAPNEISRYNLNKKIYAGIDAEKLAYEILGFIKNEEDEQFEALEVVSNLGKKDKKKLLRQLAKELGYDISEKETVETRESFFDTSEYVSDEFPIRNVKNMDMLIRHVREEFFCADPVKYEKVYRQLRTSKTKRSTREYVLGMYTNESGYHACQICKEPFVDKHIDATEIANFGIEMPQLRLCLCKKCSADYKARRDTDKDKFKRDITNAFRLIDITAETDNYVLDIGNDMALHFTQTHLAEIKEIVSLIRSNGLPSEDSDKKFSERVSALNHEMTGQSNSDFSGLSKEEREREEKKLKRRQEREKQLQKNVELIDEEEKRKQDLSFNTVKKGSKVTYRIVSDGKSSTLTIDPKIPLHEKMLGKKVGDIVKDIKGRQYEITAII